MEALIKNAFIAVEGGDAVGKTTVINFIDELLRDINVTYNVSTGHAYGNFGLNVRETILHEATQEASDTSRLLLFLANRRHIYEQVVLPTLANNGVAVVDRWHMSSFAYQPEAENLKELTSLACPILPSLNLVLVTDIDTAKERVAARGEQSDHLERRAFDKFENIKKTMTDEQLLRDMGNDYIIIDAGGTKEEVRAYVRSAVTRHLAKRGVIKSDADIFRSMLNRVSDKTVRVAAIAAMDRHDGIGIGNKLPPFPRYDLLWFKHMTSAKVCVVGRKTFESLPKITDRFFYVVTSDPNWKPKHTEAKVTVFTSLTEAINSAKSFSFRRGYRDIYVIGGRAIYDQAFSFGLIDEAYFTHVDADFGCDVVFPSKIIHEVENAWDVKELYSGVHEDRRLLIKQYTKRDI